ncbi:MAG: thymidylate synthase [Candidatus Saccharibacteria bacterium]|nr:thymidylate synthase [Candidatus Saccharibacteria bacterium]
MIQISSTSANEAWIKTFQALLEQGHDTANEKYLRDEVVLIEVTNPEVTPADERFPMPQQDIDVINRYIYSGENEENVVHEWTKLYYHRAFDEPNSQIEFLINNLNPDRPVGEAQISMWDKNIDQGQKVAPCTQIIWARIKHGKLELHVHANSSDAYKKLLMNMLEFISLQYYIAERVGVPVGKYYHFLDSCHLHFKDQEAIQQLAETLA